MACQKVRQFAISNHLPMVLAGLLILSAGLAQAQVQTPPNPPAPAPAAQASPPIEQRDPRTRAAYAKSQVLELRSPVKRGTVDVEVPSVRAIYDAIGRAFKISLNYDPTLNEVRVVAPFHMHDATLEEVLEAAGAITRSFVAPLDDTIGLILPDRPEAHSAMERTVLAYFPLDLQTTQEQMTEVITTLRTMVDLRRVIPDSKSHTLTVMGRARQVKLAEAFLESFEQPPGEVMLEVHLWELNRDRARQMGLTPARPFDLIFLPQPQNQTTATSSGGGLLGDILGSTANTAASTVTSKLPSIGSFGKLQTLYGLSFPSLQLVLNSSTTLVRSRQVARIRAMKGQKVTLLAGVRYPVLNSTYADITSNDPNQPNNAGLLPDIQYQDVGTNLTATAYFHAGGEITLQFDLANKAISSVNSLGIPTISNRQTISQVRLRDGEVYMIGGLMQSSDTKSVSGYPLLSKIPLLGKLFGVHSRNRTESEFVMAIRPIILRRDPAELIASRALFFGEELTGLADVPEYKPPEAPQQQPGLPGQPGVAPGQGLPGQQPGQPGQPGQVGQPGTPGQPQQPGQQQPFNRPATPLIQPFGQTPQQQPGTPPQPFSPFAQPQQQQPQQPVSPPIPGAPFQQQ